MKLISRCTGKKEFVPCLSVTTAASQSKEVCHQFRDGPPVAVKTIHELYSDIAECIDLTYSEGVLGQQLFEDIWSQLLIQRFERLSKERCDAIIVCAGWDYLPPWWTAIGSWLNPAGRGVFLVPLPSGGM